MILTAKPLFLLTRIRINGSIVGRVEKNGDIRLNGSIIGRAEQMTDVRQVAVMYFFGFFKL